MTLDDQITGDWDDDNDLKDKWRKSVVLQVKNCDNVELDFNTGNNDVTTNFDRGVFIAENINKLDVFNFQGGNRGSGDGDNEERVRLSKIC